MTGEDEPTLTVKSPPGGSGLPSLVCSGSFTVAALQTVDAALRDLIEKGAAVSSIAAEGVTRLDTAGAFLLHRARVALAGGGPPVPVAVRDRLHRQLIDEVAKYEPASCSERAHPDPILASIARLGEGLDKWRGEGAGMVGMTGLIIVATVRAFSDLRRMRIVPIVHHIEHTGLNAVPIIALITFLIGAVIAFMSSDILKDYGGEIFTVDLIAFAFLREFGVLLAAIMVAGRSGSAFTAEIGAMKGHEEIDAMRSLALDPIELLVVPRVIALVITLPLLTFVGDCMGIFGGGLVSWATLGMTPGMFLTRMADVTAVDHFWVGMIKAPFFAFLIAMIGCYQGFQVTGSAESVGQRTTLSVVQAIFTVIVVDALFAMFFLQIEY